MRRVDSIRSARIRPARIFAANGRGFRVSAFAIRINATGAACRKGRAAARGVYAHPKSLSPWSMQ